MVVTHYDVVIIRYFKNVMCYECVVFVSNCNFSANVTNFTPSLNFNFQLYNTLSATVGALLLSLFHESCDALGHIVSELYNRNPYMTFLY